MDDTRVKFRTAEGYKEGNVIKDRDGYIHVEDDNGIVWKTAWHKATIINEED